MYLFSLESHQFANCKNRIHNTPGPQPWSCVFLYLNWNKRSTFYNKSMKKKTKTILSASFLVSLAILSEKAYRYVFDRNAKPFEVKNNKQAPMPNVDKIEKLKIEAEKNVQHDCFETFHRINPNGDRLYATFFPSKDPSQKFILCSHGYKTTGIHEFAPFLPFYICLLYTSPSPRD